LHLQALVRDTAELRYEVVETERSCVAGREIFSDDPRISFLERLPPESHRPDIVYLNSVLQYIDDYAGLTRTLCRYRARYLLFARLSAGDVPTYATAQLNVPGSVIPYWFINIDELLGIMRSEGYKLLFEDLLARKYDQANFPARYRLGHARNLLFARA
jgi:putative methyltransferase (TIGR04325 family)